MSSLPKRYGWIPDHPDFRDYRYTPGVTGATAPVALPPAVDLRTTGNLPPVWDQGRLGSCTGNALASMFFFVDKKQGQLPFLPSRLFIYYNERKEEGTVAVDSGAMIRTGIQTIVQTGVCVDPLWPYDITKFAETPPDITYIDAKRHVASVYRRVSQNEDIKSCLNEGYPVVCGISVYDSFESQEVANSGLVPMPKNNEARVGGHAVLIVGYDATNFLIMNSWGPAWGQGGFFWIPQEYILSPDLCDDLWMVHGVAA